MRVMTDWLTAPSMVKVLRTGFKLVPGVAVKDFFAQGQTFKGHLPVVIDLRMPPNGKVSMSGFYVMLSRATTLDDVYLLHPLWPHGDEAAKDAFVALAQTQYRFDDDMKAEKVRLRQKHEATLERYKHVKLHYVDRSVSPHNCATCGLDDATAGLDDATLLLPKTYLSINIQNTHFLFPRS